MRGRKIDVGDTSCILYVRHRGHCTQKADKSGTVECDCLRWVQFRDGTRETTHEWRWSRAEDTARRLLAERMGLVDAPATADPKGYSVEKAVDEWIEEREQEQKDNVKAKYLTKKLVAWCHRNNIQYLNQIQKHALKLWRTREWKYRNGDSSSMKVHWSVLRTFFEWCVEEDLLESNPCPKFKGRVTERKSLPSLPRKLTSY